MKDIDLKYNFILNRHTSKCLIDIPPHLFTFEIFPPLFKRKSSLKLFSMG